MVVNPNEAPESYLNKGQTYHLRVVGTTPPRFTETTKYRTFIRSLSRNEDSEVVWLRLARQTVSFVLLNTLVRIALRC
jgi:hypothetical protein